MCVEKQCVFRINTGKSNRELLLLLVSDDYRQGGRVNTLPSTNPDLGRQFIIHPLTTEENLERESANKMLSCRTLRTTVSHILSPQPSLSPQSVSPFTPNIVVDESAGRLG